MRLASSLFLRPHLAGIGSSGSRCPKTPASPSMPLIHQSLHKSTTTFETISSPCRHWAGRPAAAAQSRPRRPP